MGPHVLFTLVVFVCVYWCVLFLFLFFAFVCLRPVPCVLIAFSFSGLSIFIAPSVFSDVNLNVRYDWQVWLYMNPAELELFDVILLGQSWKLYSFEWRRPSLMRFYARWNYILLFCSLSMFYCSVQSVYFIFLFSQHILFFCSVSTVFRVV